MCTGEEVQTTAWEGDEPISIDSLMVDPSDSEQQYFPVTEETYPDERGKRGKRQTGMYCFY